MLISVLVFGTRTSCLFALFRESPQPTLTFCTYKSYNRLQSISEDADFVATVQTAFPDLPVVANQRAGAWYVKPDIAEDIRAYFKSTDGHIGVHDYNVRRSNLSLVPLILQRNGCVSSLLILCIVSSLMVSYFLKDYPS